MSFFGSFFNAAMKEMEKNQNKYERANEKAANMSDEQLRRKFEIDNREVKEKMLQYKILTHYVRLVNCWHKIRTIVN